MRLISKSSKVFLSIIIAVFIYSSTSFSQFKGELSVISGYQMLGTVDVYTGVVNGEFDINDAAFYSAVFGYRVEREIIFEVQYLYQPTKVSFDPNGASKEFVVSDVDVHYIMLGAMYEKAFSRTATGYGGLSIGTAGLVPDKNYESEWRLAFGLTLGAKFMISRNIGFRLQAQGLFPVQWAGGSFYVGTGGAGYGLTAGTSIVQINVGGGLFYAF